MSVLLYCFFITSSDIQVYKKTQFPDIEIWKNITFWNLQRTHNTVRSVVLLITNNSLCIQFLVSSCFSSTNKYWCWTHHLYYVLCCCWLRLLTSLHWVLLHSRLLTPQLFTQENCTQLKCHLSHNVCRGAPMMHWVFPLHWSLSTLCVYPPFCI